MRFSAAVIILGLVILAFGCGKDPDLLSRQESTIASHFKSNGYDSLVREGVFVYVPNAERAGRSLEPVLEWGDSLQFYYEIYPFSGFNKSNVGSPSYVIATNNGLLANSIPGLNTEHMDLNIMKARLGSTKLIEGVKRGLKGSHQRDSLWLFMTSDLAYGDSSVGIIPANTPLVFVINLESVKKQ